MKTTNKYFNQELIQYITTYVNEELARGNEIEEETIKAAIDAYNGGAR